MGGHGMHVTYEIPPIQYAPCIRKPYKINGGIDLSTNPIDKCKYRTFNYASRSELFFYLIIQITFTNDRHVMKFMADRRFEYIFDRKLKLPGHSLQFHLFRHKRLNEA